MTITYKNVYINHASTIAGIYEANGPLKEYFDNKLGYNLYDLFPEIKNNL